MSDVGASSSLDHIPESDIMLLDNGYGEPCQCAPCDVRPGDLLLIDESLDHWVVVEDAIADVIDDDGVCIDWRDDADDSGSITVPTDEAVTVRRHIEEGNEHEI